VTVAQFFCAGWMSPCLSVSISNVGSLDSAKVELGEGSRDAASSEGGVDVS
jgi:hypothetical protein